MPHRFVADEMLGSLARWLRLMGYDTVYAEGMRDEEVIALSESEGRTLLTRDKGMSPKALVIESNDVEEQLREVVDALSLEVPEDPRMICTGCNGELASIDKHEYRDEIPPGTFESTGEFWRCGECGQIYWHGSHWKRIRATLSEL